MTLPYSPSRAVYAGNGTATVFPFAFKVWSEEQLVVSVTSPEGVTSVAQGWSAALNESGGAVTYLHEGTPLPEGWRLAIVRDMPFGQDIDLVSATRFDAQVIEDGLDVAAAERQQLREQLARAVIMPPTSETTPEEVVQSVYDARDAAAASASAASGSASAASDSADLAQAWAESPAPPDAEDQDSKSARTWAGLAADSADDAAASKSNAADSAALAQAWAESPTPPDPEDPESKSAKTWAAIAADTVPIATPTLAGKVKPDGASIEVTQDGTLSVPAATTTDRGLARLATQAEVQAGAAASGSPAPAVLDVNDARSLPKATDALFGLGRSATAAEAAAGATSGTGPAWVTPEELATGLAEKTDGTVIKVAERAPNTSASNWTITDLAVGKLLYLIIDVVGSNTGETRLRVVSGGVGGTDIRGNTYDFYLGEGKTNCFITYVTSNTVVINITYNYSKITAYQEAVL